MLEEEVEEELVELELVLLLDVPLGAEHSFTPPDTLVPAPNVASEHTNVPLSTLNVNLSARPNATLVFARYVMAMLGRFA